MSTSNEPNSDDEDDVFYEVEEGSHTLFTRGGSDQRPPTPNDESAQRIRQILGGGTCAVTFDGTSQNTQNSVSARGLASFNAIRCIFELEQKGYNGSDLLRILMERLTMEVCVLGHPTRTYLHPSSIVRRSLRSALIGRPLSTLSYQRSTNFLCFSNRFSCWKSKRGKQAQRAMVKF